MTIRQLALNNFGIFQGEQVLRLDLSKIDKPIVLVGGENGRGKTTILEAVFLALYGKLSPFVPGGKSYGSYLKKRVNDGAGEGIACVAVTLEHLVDGEPCVLEVRRSWTRATAERKDELLVTRDGWDDAWLSDNWTTYWTQVLPPDIASLFFFDGERIESLADPVTSARVIKDSLYALFRIAPLQRLRGDLDIVQRRALDSRGEHDADDLDIAFSRYSGLAREHEELRRNASELVQDRAALISSIESLTLQLERTGRGADVLRSRNTIREGIASLEGRLHEIDEQLRVLAADVSPFLLISDLVERTGVRLAGARSAERQKIEREVALMVHRQLSDWLRARADTIGSDVVAAIDEAFGSLTPHEPPNGADELPGSVLSQAATWDSLRSNMTRVNQELRELLAERAVVVEERDRKEATILTLPAEEEVKSSLDREAELHRKLSESETQHAILEERVQASMTSLDRARAEYTRTAERLLRAQTRNSEAARVITHAQRTQALLQLLEDRLVRKHLSRLEIELTEKLARLHSKRLVNHVRINPESFEVQLLSEDGTIVPASRLSAGERQLLALSVLWAVQSYSDRKMPMIVDTPLGRLDTTHRKHMVERFLTEASHQVIVLSTDSEVTPELVASVSEAVSAYYRLDYDPDRRHSTVNEGYFPARQAVEQAHEYQQV